MGDTTKYDKFLGFLGGPVRGHVRKPLKLNADGGDNAVDPQDGIYSGMTRRNGWMTGEHVPSSVTDRLEEGD